MFGRPLWNVHGKAEKLTGVGQTKLAGGQIKTMFLQHFLPPCLSMFAWTIMWCFLLLELQSMLTCVTVLTLLTASAGS